MPIDPSQTTQLLERLTAGDESAADRLLPLLYEELRRLAGHYFHGQRASHTLQPTALVHEAYIKLVNNRDAQWEGRSHFVAVAARAMRQILINHARESNAAKRGGDWDRITIDRAVADAGQRDFDLLSLDDAMTRLEALNERQCRVVELRFFGGLTIAEAAQVLGVGTTTVEDDWYAARAWLARELR